MDIDYTDEQQTPRFQIKRNFEEHRKERKAERAREVQLNSKNSKRIRANSSEGRNEPTYIFANPSNFTKPSKGRVNQRRLTDMMTIAATPCSNQTYRPEFLQSSSIRCPEEEQIFFRARNSNSDEMSQTFS